METVTIASYNSMEEAAIVRGMLEANGIRCGIADHNNLYVPVFGGVDLIVAKDDAAKARELLNEHRGQ